MSGRDSLGADYFDPIFADDEDPWNLAASPYEAAKFAETCEALSDRRYARALEVGCAHGVLTEKLLGLCDALLAVDISRRALDRAHARLDDRAGLRLQRMAFPRETPPERDYDLVVLSEVAYYWSDADLGRAADWLRNAVAPGGRTILVHYTGRTDYPQTGDGAVLKLQELLGDAFSPLRATRASGYRLDLWVRA